MAVRCFGRVLLTSQLKGRTDGMDLSVITEIAEYFENTMGEIIPERTPFVGRNFNSTCAGIHADGMLKNEEIYNIFNTEKILNRPVGILIGQHSGAAGIAHWVNTHFHLKDSEQMNKQDALILLLKDEVDKEYASGRTTAFSDDELEKLLKSVDREGYYKLALHMENK